MQSICLYVLFIGIREAGQDMWNVLDFLVVAETR